MHTKDWGSFTLSNALLTSTALAALVAGVFSISAGSLIQSLSQEATVSVSPSELLWWSQVHVGFDQADPTLADLLPASDSLTVSAALNSNVQLTPAKKIQRQVSVLPKVHRTGKVQVAVASAPLKDQIVVSQGAPVAVVIAPTVDSASEQERSKLRNIHLSLRGRFQTALTTQPQMTTQVAVQAPASIQAIPEAEPAAKQVVNEMPAVMVPKPFAVVKVFRKKAKPQLLSAKRAVAQPVVERKIAPQPVFAQTPDIKPGSKNEALSIAVQAQPADQLIMSQAQAAAFKAVSSPAKPGGLAREGSAVRVAENASQQLGPMSFDEPAPSNIEPTTVNTQPGEINGDMRALAQGAIDKGDYSWVPLLMDLNSQKVTTQTTHQSAATGGQSQPVPATAPPVHKVSTYSVTADPEVTQNPAPPAPPAPSPPVSVASTGWEIADPQLQTAHAFDPSSPVYGSYSKYLSHEGPTRGLQSRWVQTHLEGFWPTLSWQAPDAQLNFKGKAQLMSNETALTLATLTSTSLQQKAGIIFGIVPAGWRIEFSGRAEAPVYLDQNRERVNPLNVDGPRSFGLVNAAPGVNLIYMVGPTTKDRVAIAIPVEEGQATYLNLPEPQKKTFSGAVLNGRQAQSQGIASVEVRVVGQTGKSIFTRASGFFEIDEVYTVGNFPLFFETEAQLGYTHRYRVSPEKPQSLTLFRFSEKRIKQWLAPLEGGVSADSGLVVGSVAPATVQGAGEGLFPVLEAMNESSTLRPESYTLDSEDLPQVKAALQVQSPRFLSVQIPEGLNQARVEDGRSRIYWSQYVIASPGVINVILPE